MLFVPRKVKSREGRKEGEILIIALTCFKSALILISGENFFFSFTKISFEYI